MKNDTADQLRALVQDISKSLPDVSEKKMFGCNAFFAGGKIYALIWKTGRIGVKLPEPAMYDELISMEGSEPWQAGNKVMTRWVLVPGHMHDDRRTLRKWVQRAHAQALAREE